MRRKLVISGIVALFLAGILAVVWTALDWPPPRLIMKYGLPPAGGQTGRTQRVAGFTFTEISRGYAHVSWRVFEESGTWIERFCDSLALPIGPAKSDCFADEWVEIKESYWISTWTVDCDSIAEYAWQDRASLGTESGAPERWLARVGGGSSRTPSRVELQFAAACGVWDGCTVLCTSQDSNDPTRGLALLGEALQGFEGTKLELLRRVRIYTAQQGAYRRTLNLKGPWRSPPLIWIPAEDP